MHRSSQRRPQTQTGPGLTRHSDCRPRRIHAWHGRLRDRTRPILGLTRRRLQRAIGAVDVAGGRARTSHLDRRQHHRRLGRIDAIGRNIDRIAGLSRGWTDRQKRRRRQCKKKGPSGRGQDGRARRRRAIQEPARTGPRNDEGVASIAPRARRPDLVPSEDRLEPDGGEKETDAHDRTQKRVSRSINRRSTEKGASATSSALIQRPPITVLSLTA